MMWRDRLAQVAEMDDVPPMARELAARAVDKMKWIESNVPRC